LQGELLNRLFSFPRHRTQAWRSILLAGGYPAWVVKLGRRS
jgi:hypothetical protein